MKGDSSCSLRGDCRVGGYGAYEDLSPRNHGLLRALACHNDPEVRFASVRESASSLQLTAFHQGKEIYSSLHSLPFSSELKWCANVDARKCTKPNPYMTGMEERKSIHPWSVPCCSRNDYSPEACFMQHPTPAANVNTCGPEVPVKYTSGQQEH